MKRICRFFVAIYMLCPALVWGQTKTVTYSHDTGGDRVERSIARSTAGSDEKEIRAGSSTRHTLAYTEDEKFAHFQERVREHEVFLGRLSSLQPRTVPDTTIYAVGEIPLQEGLTPTGGRTYAVSIPTAAGFKFSPSVSIGYNSQAAEGWVGYGWNIQGVSSISLINKSKYYHGIFKAADTEASDQVFALDGIPFVTNDQSILQSEFPLIVARSYILAAPQYNQSGYISGFTVKYPNGVTAQYGIGADVPYYMPSYPVTQMTDLEGNVINFVYSADTVNGNDRLDAIRYGYDSQGQYTGEIVFNYEHSQDSVVRYFAGKSRYYNWRLSDVVSKSGADTISRYILSYKHSADSVQLLDKVECRADTSALRPLKFQYGPLDEAWHAFDYLERNDTISLGAGYISPSQNYIYRRGKFIRDNYRDGVIIHPRYHEYTAISGYPGHYLFGSGYPSNQKILIAFKQANSSYVDSLSILTEAGFQTLEAVDVNGDGLEEIVKVNLNGAGNNQTHLLLKVYRCNGYGTPEQVRQFVVNLQGCIYTGNGPIASPAYRTFLWGDFLGNGKVQLLTLAFDQNVNYLDPSGVYSQTSYAALIDIAEETKLCDSELFTFPQADEKCVFVCDLDHDGKSELCRATANGLQVYGYNATQQGFVLEKTLVGITSSILSSAGRPYYITDLNGDGYIDILQAPAVGSGSVWDRYAYNGKVFCQSSLTITARADGDVFTFLDVNRDGLADLVKVGAQSMGTYINRNGQSFGPYKSSPYSISGNTGVVPVNVVDYSAASGFMKVSGNSVYGYGYTANVPETRPLTKVVDSRRRMFINTYTYLPHRSLDWTDGSFGATPSEGYAFRTLPIYVLSEEDAFLTDNTYQDSYRRKLYSYFNGVVNSLGLGFCGFWRIDECDKTGPKDFFTTRVYNPQRFGVPLSTKIRMGYPWANPYVTITNTYDIGYGNGGPSKKQPRLLQSVTANTLTGIIDTTSYTYGSYDIPISILSGRRIGSGMAQTERIDRIYWHSVSSSQYYLGQLRDESVTKDADGDTTTTWLAQNIYTYDSYARPLTKRYYVQRKTQNPFLPHDPLLREGDDADQADAPGRPIVPLGGNLVSTTQWQYDGYGNVISEKTAPYDATVFTGSTFAYDSEGRHLLSETDALGHTTTYAGYNKYGKPASATDYRGRTKTFTYDEWGNLVRTVYPDSTIELTSRAWLGTGRYSVSETVTGKPNKVTHYDALGHEVRYGLMRYDGQWQWTDKEYNSKGQLSRVSLPYRGTAPAYWNRYTYDNYDRPDSLIQSSGNVTRWTYYQNSVTTRKDGVLSTRTTDARGNVVSVTDAGGTIAYTYRDDGQLKTVTGPGNMTTSIAYDAYGRRTSISDPSAGVREDAYEWDSDGSSTITHTTPHGTVKTYKDRFGRTTLIERSGEFDTAFTYDVYGRLSVEQSTNGTGKTYTYDSLDRVSSTVETAPDGKWLKMVYSYGSGSVLASILYISQADTLTTETYQYANGHPTGITLPDGTVVWSLVSENDLGAATQITSGTVSREYGFTAYGLPTYRKMDGGELQDFRYQFDAAKGNLQWRTDAINNQTEVFTYDNLNRLTGIGSRTVTYAANGNILSMDGVGDMVYGASAHPNRITSLSLDDDDLVPNRQQTVSYTSFDRPSTLSEDTRTAAFTYNADGERVKMAVTDGNVALLTRYYLGGRYEFDVTSSGTAERLYLGGDAYSAPMVWLRTGSGSWAAYNIGRDYLGSITHVATADGTLVAEYSYDPWGRLRDPETLAIYAPGFEPDLILGRGFTGHEHLTWFGLINMNARLYDPLLGRFLSPDPYVQAPDFTQNLNRYSYALNNPLRYTDSSGEFVLSALAVGAIIGGIMGLISGYKIGEKHGATGMKMVGYVLGGGVIGAIGGIAGGAVAASMTPVITAAGYGGFIAGSVTGSIAGATSGFISGMGYSLLNGESITDAFYSGSIGLLSGAAIGALTGGVIEGARAVKNGQDFWTGVVSPKPELSFVKKGEIGEEMAKEMIAEQGGTIQNDQVTIKVGGTRVRLDCVADFDGETVLVEVKNGPHARFTHNQSIVYPQLSNPLPEIRGGMPLKAFIDLQRGLQPSIPITPVGGNARMVWPQGGSITNYTFIIIRF